MATIRAFMSETGGHPYHNSRIVGPQRAEHEARRILAVVEPLVYAKCETGCAVDHRHTNKVQPMTWHERIYPGETDSTPFWALAEALDAFLQDGIQ